MILLIFQQYFCK